MISSHSILLFLNPFVSLDMLKLEALFYDPDFMGIFTSERPHDGAIIQVRILQIVCRIVLIISYHYNS